MDCERAELHLRRLAEAELRDAAEGHGKPPYRLAALTGRRGPGGVRLSRVAQALVAVDAVDVGTAGDILRDLHIALTVRRDDNHRAVELLRTAAILRSIAAPAAGVTHSAAPKAMRAPVPRHVTGSHLAGSSVAASRVTGSRVAGTGIGPVPHRVAPAGVMIPIRVNGGSGELYLLAYAHTGAGARFTFTGWFRGMLEPGHLIDQVTFTDAKGNAYRAGFAGSVGIAECTGQLRVIPEPPTDIEWLDVTAGDLTRRVPLTATAPSAEVITRQRTAGEQYLHLLAAGLLASVPVFPGERRIYAVLPPGHVSGLGDVITALQAAGTLSLLNPLRGQLVTLCESLGHRDHDIGAPPARDLPEQWVSMLSYHLRRKPSATQPADGAAGLAIAFPPVDGVALSALGLHNNADTTVLHASAVLPAGHLSQRPLGYSGHTVLDPMHDLPLIWLRDDGGRWHTIRRQVSSYNHDDHELMLQLEIVPPLPRTSALEIVVSGADCEARATLPLRWR